jgi:Fe-S oxidoreductase
MGRELFSMVRRQLPQYRDILPPDRAKMVLLVEHTGKSAEQVKKALKETDEAVGPAASGRRTILEGGLQDRYWKLRKDAVPLLQRARGRKKPVPFIEDVSVGPRRLAEYISGLETIAGRHGIELAMYGHAGDGELHVRPYLDLGDPADVRKMLDIANEVFSLAWSLGGAISGEHADGLVRSAFLRRQYGDEFYELLRAVKNVFDPAGLMNPGKIINDGPAEEVMTRNLRAGHGFLPGRLRAFGGDSRGDPADELLQCSGCGLCLSADSALRMCPVFRALGDELAGSRAKANVLRFWATGRISDRQFDSPLFKKFLSMCVGCRACSLECPSGVDVASLVSAARREYARRRGLSRAEILLSHNRFLSIMGSRFAPVANCLCGLRPFKWLLEAVGRLDSRRQLPRFEYGSFVKAARRYLACRKAVARPASTAAYFVDTFANYNDHELAFAVLGVLRHNDIDVVVPRQRPVPLPAIVYGNEATARRDLSYNVRHLAAALRGKHGCRIVCSEPSAALCLKSDLGRFVAGGDAELVSESTDELMDYLLGLFRQGRLKRPLKPVEAEFAYHRPCHLMAVTDRPATVELLEGLCGAKVRNLGAGCCGLAGTFGMNTANYDLSVKIGGSLAAALDKLRPGTVLTECSACRMQIEHLRRGTRVMHPVRVIAAAYGL